MNIYNSRTASLVDNDFFTKSGLFSLKKWNHHPAIVIDEKNNRIDIVENKDNLFEYNDDCIVLHQWEGRWSSDFF